MARLQELTDISFKCFNDNYMNIDNEKRHPLMSGKRNDASKIENVIAESLKKDELLDSLLSLHYLINILADFLKVH